MDEPKHMFFYSKTALVQIKLQVLFNVVPALKVRFSTFELHYGST